MLKQLSDKALSTLEQRGKDNGYDKKAGTAQEERSAAQIARVYNAITGQNMSEADAWTFLQCLKLVRLENQVKTGSGDLLDTCVDMVSYGLLKSETVLKTHRPAQVRDLLNPPANLSETIALLEGKSTLKAEINDKPSDPVRGYR